MRAATKVKDVAREVIASLALVGDEMLASMYFMRIADARHVAYFNDDGSHRDVYRFGVGNKAFRALLDAGRRSAWCIGRVQADGRVGFRLYQLLFLAHSTLGG